MWLWIFSVPKGAERPVDVRIARTEAKRRPRSRHRRWQSQGFGDMSPTSILEGFTATGNPLKYAILRKIALLADL